MQLLKKTKQRKRSIETSLYTSKMVLTFISHPGSIEEEFRIDEHFREKNKCVSKVASPMKVKGSASLLWHKNTTRQPHCSVQYFRDVRTAT